jgi:hypothetical protein
MRRRFIATVLVAAVVLPGIVGGAGTTTPPPAFRGSNCSPLRPNWSSENTVYATVFGIERLSLHPDFPPNCSADSHACDGKAYLISGDHVWVGQKCGVWTDVEFQGDKVTSWGWVESAHLREAGAFVAGFFNFEESDNQSASESELFAYLKTETSIYGDKIEPRGYRSLGKGAYLVLAGGVGGQLDLYFAEVTKKRVDPLLMSIGGVNDYFHSAAKDCWAFQQAAMHQGVGWSDQSMVEAIAGSGKEPIIRHGVGVLCSR